MLRLRRNRAVAGFGIVVIATATLLPGLVLLDHALFEPVWVVLLDETAVLFDFPLTSGDEQPVPLLLLLPSRAPPTHVDA